MGIIRAAAPEGMSEGERKRGKGEEGEEGERGGGGA